MSNNRFRILIVDSYQKDVSPLRALLEENGYQTIVAETCAMGKTMFDSYNPDVIITELDLPDKNGRNLIQFVRQTSAVPILVLSGIDEEEDKITTMDLGANDYIVKPYHAGEFLARIRVALRLRRYFSGVAPVRDTFILGALAVDYGKRHVFIGSRKIKLTQTEYNILSFLTEHPNRVLSYAVISRSVWGMYDAGSVKKLQVNISNIRKKLDLIPDGDDYILNVPGVGYRISDLQETI